MFYALSSKNQEFFKDKVSIFIALAAVTSPSGCINPFILFLTKLKLADQLFNVMDFIGIYELLGPGLPAFVNKKISEIFPNVALFFDGKSFNTDPSLEDPDRWQVYNSHIPSSASLKSIVHYSQNIQRKIFQMYDYGSPDLNEQKYGPGNSNPPVINLSKIQDTKIPVAIFCGKQDMMATIEDCHRIRD